MENENLSKVDCLQQIVGLKENPKSLGCQEQDSSDIDVSILMPCLNEAQTLQTCITKAREFLHRTGIRGEVVVADNGSEDGSQSIAIDNGARVIQVAEKGYGSALIKGIQGCQGKFVIMGDSDDSYDFSKLDSFVEALRSGCDLVMGNRFAGGIQSGAMPWLHRYVGNPVLSFIGKTLYRVPINDFHCGLRGFNRERILTVGLVSPGMEFASEMVVKSANQGLSITEVPTTLAPDGRNRPPHLNSWRDGWRHLKFLLIYSPKWLFLYPGIFLIVLGVLLQFILQFGVIYLNGVGLDIHTMLYASGATIIGMQMTIFAVQAKRLGVQNGLMRDTWNLPFIVTALNLERTLLLAFLMLVVGVAVSTFEFLSWGAQGFGSLDPRIVMRKVIPSITLVICGFQLGISAFFFSTINYLIDTSRKISMGDRSC